MPVERPEAVLPVVAECKRDRAFAVLALTMWAGTAVKAAPAFSRAHNLQSAMGWIASESFRQHGGSGLGY